MELKFYAICSTQVELEGLSETNLLTEPHPTDFQEYHEVVGTTGEGKPVGAGFPWTTWEYENQILSAEQWDQLQDFFSGNQAYANVYIRTRINKIIGGKYQYKNFSAIMHRPKGTPKPAYRYADVSIEFTRLEDLS